MRIRELAAWAVLGLALSMAGCGPGSGRYTGTDVSVSGLAPAGPLYGGDSVAFVMTVANIGEFAASNLTITNLIGNQMLVAEVECAAEGGAVCPSPPSVRMTVPELPTGGVLTFTVRANLVAGANGTVSNTLSATSDQDVERLNNSATVFAEVQSNNLKVTGSAVSETVSGGAATAFTMVVGNDGPAAAYDVDLTSTLSANLTPAGVVVCTPSGGAVAPVATPEGTLRSAAIPMGGLLTCNVPARVTAGANGPATSTMTVQAAGDERSSDNSAIASTQAISTDLGVSQTSPAQIGAGSTAVFTAVVANPGPGPANNLLIQWTPGAAPGVSFGVPTCTASGGATCPAVLGPVMTVPTLGVGRSLRFTFSAATEATFRGPIVNTVSVSADGDTSSANNTASSATVAVDPRNGSYAAFAADGRPYTLTVDFDNGSYLMSGNGSSAARSFTVDAATRTYVVQGNARFRVAQDLIVGGHDFGGGVLPFAAARSFATTVPSIAGSYDLATRNVVSSGAATTHAGTAVVSGNTLTVCQSDTVVVAVLNCDAGARTDYVLSVSGSVFTGRTSAGESLAFSVAQSGAAKLLLSAAPAPDGSRQLRIGLPDSAAGLIGGQFAGSSTNGDWVETTLTPAAVSYVGSSNADSAPLSRIHPSAGPFGMLTGVQVGAGSRIYLLQASPLAVLVGGFGGAPSASGLLQLSLP
ncbi:MAG: hypothetical protein IPG91_04625 [Ideonella sp.]|nr:hypothetical protein [Ideonella sp.]